jgi:hypothetical protein
MLLGSQTVELRSFIYDFASEDLNAQEYAPHVGRMFRSPMAWNKQPWKFFGLTQACKLISAEYCPLWSRNLSIRVRIEHLPDFDRDFLQKEHVSQNLRRHVQFDWLRSLDEKNGQEYDITSILRLGAGSPDITFEFVPIRIANRNWSQANRIC